MMIPLNDEVGRVAVDTVLEKLVADGYLPESTYGNMSIAYQMELSELVIEKLSE